MITQSMVILWVFFVVILAGVAWILVKKYLAPEELAIFTIGLALALSVIEASLGQ